MRKERVGEREKGREMRFCDVQRSRSPRGSPASAPGGRRSFQSVCLAVAVAVTVALACRSRRGAASAGTGGGLGLVRRVAVPGSLRMRMRPFRKLVRVTIFLEARLRDIARRMILTEDVPLLLEMGAPSRGT